MKDVMIIITGIVTAALAIYVGLVFMFVGGIAQIVDAVQENPINGSSVAWGVLRFFGAGFVAAVIIMVGTFIISEIELADGRRRRKQRRDMLTNRRYGR